MKLNVTIPVFNEERRLARGIRCPVPFLAERPACDYELVIADNASTDGMAEIARRLEAEFPRLRVVRLGGQESRWSLAKGLVRERGRRVQLHGCGFVVGPRELPGTRAGDRVGRGRLGGRLAAAPARRDTTLGAAGVLVARLRSPAPRCLRHAFLRRTMRVQGHFPPGGTSASALGGEQPLALRHGTAGTGGKSGLSHSRPCRCLPDHEKPIPRLRPLVSAFTLVELLVVIGILGLLFSCPQQGEGKVADRAMPEQPEAVASGECELHRRQQRRTAAGGLSSPAGWHAERAGVFLR